MLEQYTHGIIFQKLDYLKGLMKLNIQSLAIGLRLHP